MNNNKKFKTFLEELKGHGQDSLIESVKEGFNVCFESEMFSDSDVELHDYEIKGPRVENFVFSIKITPEMLKHSPAVAQAVQKQIDRIKTDESFEAYREFLVNGTIDKYVTLDISGSLDTGAEFSGGFYSAGPSGPAETPDWEYGDTTYKNLKAEVVIEGENGIPIPIENEEFLKYVKSKVETAVIDGLAEEMEEMAWEADDAPRAPKNFRTSYYGPM